MKKTQRKKIARRKGNIKKRNIARNRPRYREEVEVPIYRQMKAPNGKVVMKDGKPILEQIGTKIKKLKYGSA